MDLLSLQVGSGQTPKAMSEIRVLIVGDVSEELRTLEEFCLKNGFDAVSAKFEGAVAMGHRFQVAIVRVGGEGSRSLMEARAITGRLALRWPTVGVAIIGPRLSGADLAGLISQGRIADCIPWPVPSPQRFCAAVKLADERHRLLLSVCSAEPGRGPAGESLTPRDAEIARLVLAGLSPAEIGSYLSLSIGTVRNRLSLLYHKLGARDRAHAVARLQGIV